MSNSPSDLERQLQQLLDKEDIRTLMSRYCHGIDKKDETLFMGIWAEDACYELPRGSGRGTEGIRQLVRKVWREVPKCHHHITNPLIEVQGDKASARTDVTYFRETADGVLCLLSGGYTFEFARVNGEWKTKYLKFDSFVSTSPMFEKQG